MKEQMQRKPRPSRDDASLAFLLSDHPYPWRVRELSRDEMEIRDANKRQVISFDNSQVLFWRGVAVAVNVVARMSDDQ